MKVVSYKCPNCMAPMKHDIDTQMWLCEFCNTSVSPEDAGNLEALSGNEQVEEEYVTPPAGVYSAEDGAVAYVCPSCGGHIITNEVTAATFCVYCHNPAVIAAHLDNEYRPNYILPFKVKKEQAIIALKKLCRKKPLLPRRFRDIVNKGDVAGMYVPFWLYDIDMSGFMRAWGKKISRWSDSKYNYTKTDTYLVERAGSAGFCRIPADGSSRMDDKLMDAIEPFDYNQMVDFEMQYLSGHFAESYDVDSNACLQRAGGRSNEALRDMLRGTIGGYSSVSVANFNSRYDRVQPVNVMLPVWTVLLPYNKKTYTFAMNGQSGKLVGRLPISVGRFFSLLGIIAGAAALLTMLGIWLYMLYSGGGLS